MKINNLIIFISGLITGILGTLGTIFLQILRNGCAQPDEAVVGNGRDEWKAEFTSAQPHLTPEAVERAVFEMNQEIAPRVILPLADTQPIEVEPDGWQLEKWGDYVG